MSDIQDQIGDAFAAAGDVIQGALGQSEKWILYSNNLYKVLNLPVGIKDKTLLPVGEIFMCMKKYV